MCHAAATDSDEADTLVVADVPALSSLELHPVITEFVRLQGCLQQPTHTQQHTQGFINTEPVPADNAAAVFAIFDDNRKLQYIGFSKGMEQSLRTVFTRRPDKAFFWKCVVITQIDH